jgi:hypothetical protein
MNMGFSSVGLTAYHVTDRVSWARSSRCSADLFGNQQECRSKATIHDVPYFRSLLSLPAEMAECTPVEYTYFQACALRFCILYKPFVHKKYFKLLQSFNEVYFFSHLLLVKIAQSV